MTHEPMNNSLESNRPGRLTSYVEKFGFPFPRPQIVKYAANHGAMDLLEEMLQERVRENKPVEDWSAFGLKLQERLRQRYKAA